LYEPSGTEPTGPARGHAQVGRVGTRCLDVLGAGTGLVLLSPLLLALALAVKVTSPGPALFRSTRIGRNARPFTLYKFRSMIVGARAVGPAITAANDPRITSLGVTLRRMKLDELPQFLNVLKGDMSLVGPRPEDPNYVMLYSRDQMAVLEVKPGMTSPASLQYHDEEAQLTGDDWKDRYVKEVMPKKLEIDLAYALQRSPLSDLGVIFATIRKLLCRWESHPS
jgi:lipopolysaccharide/colanic/teichoic acid biosynthesis glycosyltransferase